MSNRREHRRWPRRIQVRFWRPDRPDETYHGFTSDVSESGAYIVTTTPVGTNARIRLELLGDRGGFVAEAVVRRSRRVHRELLAVRESGMGVRFLGIGELIHELMPYAEVANGDLGSAPGSDEGPDDAVPSKDQSAATAPPAGEPTPVAGGAPPAVQGRSTAAPQVELPVRFRGVEDLRQIYERDLQHGGMFLATSKPAAVGTRVRLALYLPGSESPFLAEAQVVQVFAPGGRPSAAPNLLSGMGVLFDDPAKVLALVQPLLASSGASGR